jgi:hypothetical protein
MTGYLRLHNHFSILQHIPPNASFPGTSRKLCCINQPPNVYQTLYGLHFHHDDERTDHNDTFECIKKGDEEKKHTPLNIACLREAVDVYQ